MAGLHRILPRSAICHHRTPFKTQSHIRLPATPSLCPRICLSRARFPRCSGLLSNALEPCFGWGSLARPLMTPRPSPGDIVSDSRMERNCSTGRIVATGSPPTSGLPRLFWVRPHLSELFGGGGRKIGKKQGRDCDGCKRDGAGEIRKRDANVAVGATGPRLLCRSPQSGGSTGIESLRRRSTSPNARDLLLIRGSSLADPVDLSPPFLSCRIGKC